MRNLTGFMHWLEFNDIRLKVINGKLVFNEGCKKPSEKIIQEIKQNKVSIAQYLTLDVDRTKPCRSSKSDCKYSMPTLGCMNPKYKSIEDKYLENCLKCEGYIKG